jgi:MFS family permease
MAAPDLAPPRFGSAFRHGSFARFWAGRTLSMVASQMQVVAVGWLVYDLTRDPLDLGLVGLVQFLPTLLLVLVSGHVVDSFDRRRILLICLAVDALAASALATMAATGAARPGLVFATVAVIGATRAFAGPANQSLVSAVVPMEDLPNAVAWNSSAMQTAAITGPAVGGLLYAFGPEVVFLTGLVLFLASFGFIVTVRTRPVQLARRALNWESLGAGIAFIRSRPIILGAISLDLFAVLLGGATALLPIYARDILLVGPWGLGLLRGAPAVGALIMAVVLARWTLKRRAGRWLLGAVALFGAATVVFALSRDVVLSCAALAVLGAADQISVYVRQTLVQLGTPDHMRGRVGAVSSLFIGASNQLGEFESGFAAALFGTVPAAVLGGVGAMLIALLWAWRFPALRRVEGLH